MGSSFGAGAGADALQEIIRRKAEEAFRYRQMEMDQQRIQQQGNYQNAELGLRRDAGERADAASARAEAAANAPVPVMRLTADGQLVQAGEAPHGSQVVRDPQAPAQKPDKPILRIGRDGKIQNLGTYPADAQVVNEPAPQQPRDERLVQIQGPNGTPIWVREGDAVGKPAMQAPRAVTGAERQTLAYFNRMKEALDSLEGGGLEDQISKQGLLWQAQGQLAPNIMQSGPQQQYRQAQRAFTEGRLRKESGAAIPTSEYENDAKTYFFQPGDTEPTTAQKRAARKKVLEGLKFSSGRAYQEFYGDEGSPAPHGNKADPLGIR